MDRVCLDKDSTIHAAMTRSVVTVGMDDSLQAVRALFKEHTFHHLVVVEQGKAVGVLSERDLLKHVSPFIDQMSERKQDTWTLNKRVHQIMNRDLVWADENTTVYEACLMMAANSISCLPVLDERSRPVGIVTARDLLRWLADQLEPDAGEGYVRPPAA